MESGSFGTFGTGEGGLLSGVEFSGSVTLTSGENPADTPSESGGE